MSENQCLTRAISCADARCVCQEYQCKQLGCRFSSLAGLNWRHPAQVDLRMLNAANFAVPQDRMVSYQES